MDKYPTCPYCEEMEEDWYDGLEPKYDGDTWPVRCSECGKEYHVAMCVDVSFTSARKPFNAPGGPIHNKQPCPHFEPEYFCSLEAGMFEHSCTKPDQPGKQEND